MAETIDGGTARVAQLGERLYAELGSLVLELGGLTLGLVGIFAVYYAASRLPPTPLIVVGLFLTGALGSVVAGFLMAARRRQQFVRRILGTLGTGSFALSLAYLSQGPVGDQAFGAFLGIALVFTAFLFLSLLFDPDRT